MTTVATDERPGHQVEGDGHRLALDDIYGAVCDGLLCAGHCAGDLHLGRNRTDSARVRRDPSERAEVKEARVSLPRNGRRKRGRTYQQVERRLAARTLREIERMVHAEWQARTALERRATAGEDDTPRGVS